MSIPVQYTLIIDEKTKKVLRDIVRHQSKVVDNETESEYLHDLSEMLDDLKTDQINDFTA